MNPIEFARNLFALRMERGYTVDQIAEVLGVTPEEVCAWECARSTPSLDQSNRLARFYQIPLDEIIRNPKPHDFAVLPDPPQPEPEPVVHPAEEKPSEVPLKRRRRPKFTVWDGVVIGLILAVIGVALYLILHPDLLVL